MKGFSRNIVVYLLLFAIVFGIAFFFGNGGNGNDANVTQTEVELSKFIRILLCPLGL